MPSSKLAAVVLLVAATAGLWFWFENVKATAPVVPDSTHVVEGAGNTDETNTGASTETGSIDPEDAIVRDPTLVSDSSRRDLPQGIKGRVLLPNGAPAAGLAVTLLPNMRSEPLKAYLMTQSGQVIQPLATTTTHADGSFAVGIQKANESVDLRITSVDYPEVTRVPIDVSSNEWHDVGDLQLEQGLIVQGRVLDAVSNTVVSNATVYLEANQNLLAAPGLQRGTALEVAADGSFKFFNAPRNGLVNLTIEADGYAPHRLVRQQLKATAANDFTIKMEPGHPLTGIVVDEQGNAIRGAQVTAQALSAKTPQKETVYSDDDGLFEFAALAAGPYRLDTKARNHSDVSTPIALTDEDIKVVMTRRTAIKLRVLGSNGRDVKSYKLSLKRSFETGIGNVFGFRDRNITPRNYTGKWATIENVPYGKFCFQLTDNDHAKTLSPTFDVVPGEGNIEVVATLTTGAEITGTVIDGQGNPVAGAHVTTHRDGMDGFAAGFLGKLGGMVPEKHQTRSTKTDNQGRFRLKALSFADYMVTAAHPAFCKASAKHLKLVREGQVVDAGVIQMQKGAILTGTTSIDGNPAGQVEVKISLPQDVVEQAARNKEPINHFSAQARSDNSGAYRVLHRLPPGRYWITASRPDPNNMFATLLQMKQTGRELIIRPGQETAEMSFNVPWFDK